MHVLITGANRGVGRALADGYRAAGADVMGTSRDGRTGWRLDVTAPHQHKSFAQTLAGRPVDMLVCNAGVYLDKGQDLDTGYPAEMWTQTFAANVTGVFLTIQALLPNLRLSENPKIAIISSQMASQALAPGGSYIYRASKAAALNLGRNLAADLKPRGIAVGIYHPGWVRTDMGGGAAEIDAATAAAGLIQRFAELSLETTGCFRTWDGRDHPM
ncbi:SDR family NAD(P)-dependent oxidoreductase [Jhaorihella thermophila]|uniref:NAD(P)-dependent dehydrogenase, short-chain alcohol dehydrogenase family n=1 Tax=Jhaorihella thermophila TaxID=488547 RepID=A0A1H5YXI3_9RHOB|nr:SDR family NAD(P)-dependent oxidoreductase [Jhaorihella thermophila]SEG28738.1 NAD(P)-dependent dehydrogenase, short-chain alcohol dehydrogenase family [Jhaorihella thermophila]